jgi:hypothetical protein
MKPIPPVACRFATYPKIEISIIFGQIRMLMEK